MNEIFDIAIIGSGVAGIQAAINAKIRNKKMIIFGTNQLSSKLVKAHRIDNFLGFYGKSGNELHDAFQAHLNAMDIHITEEKITAVYPMGDTFMLAGAGNVYTAKKVILAIGVDLGKPIENEALYLGQGVSYCATCDGPLYKGKTVIVIGGSQESILEANYLNELADHVYFVPLAIDINGLDESIEIIKDFPQRIEEMERQKLLVMKNSTLKADGIFILKNSVSPEQLVPGLEIEDRHIKVNRQMETNIPGLYAAGDCTGKPYQYMKAAGEGHVAGLAAIEALDLEKVKA